MELTLKVYPNQFKIDSIINILGTEVSRELKLERLLTTNSVRSLKLEQLDQAMSIRPERTTYGRLYDVSNSKYEIELARVSHVISNINYYFDSDFENIKIESIKIKTLSTPDGKILDGLIMAGFEFELVPVKIPTTNGYEKVVAFDIVVPTMKKVA